MYKSFVFRFLDEKVNHLESQLSFSTDLITQLRHDLQVKSDLLRVYTNDESVASEDASPVEVKSANVEILQKKIDNLEKENRKLHEEATEVR